MLHPTHRARTPYLFHFEGQTVALGEPKFLEEINELLLRGGASTRPTFWDQAYLVEMEKENPELIGQGFDTYAGPDDMNLLNSVGVSMEKEQFWDTIQTGVLLGAKWPEGNETAFMPQMPDWLKNARSWEYDPVAPPDGPGNLGGWTRVRSREGSGQPVGLFQLTDPDSFWVLGSVDELDAVMALCKEFASFREGFDLATGYIDESGRYSCIALPIVCRSTMEEELFIAGIDCESLFWE